MILRSISGVRGTAPKFNSEAIQQYTKDGLFINLQGLYKIILLISIIINPVFGSHISIDQSKNDEHNTKLSKVKNVELIEKSTDEDKTIDANKELKLAPISSISLKIYTGSEEQNKALLKTGGFEGISIVDALKAIGVNSDFESRKKLYQDTFTKLPETSNDSENKLVKKEGKDLQQICYIYIDSNLKGLPVFINENYVGTTPIDKPIKLEYGQYKIWCVPPVLEKLPNGKTLYFNGNMVSFITVDTEVQSHFIDISQKIK
ncbi:MAG: hypothetical protein IIB45_09730 [Candidatus Marinimicrobia bacterium]|nr:hypothetical protein [Candidatus Neomarinimicrobiota bacterium]